MKRKCHMEIPHFVFHAMEAEFGELKPLFLKFAHSHINLREVEEIVSQVDHDLAAGALKLDPNPFKSQMAVKNALDTAFHAASGDKKLDQIKEIYLKCCVSHKNAFLKMVQDRYKAELESVDVESSWRDLTSIYPDQFDGDNITFGNYHSCKFADPKSVEETPVWDGGHVCHSIQALTWRISGLYKEFCKEPDVFVSEQSKMSMIEELIRLTHYVLDSSTIVHLMHTSSYFHNNFEEDLDGVVDDILPKINVEIKTGLIDLFSNDAYGEADKRAKETFKKFYFGVLELYGKETKNNDKAQKAFSKGDGLDLAKQIIQNACQNLADFWGYTLEICKVEKDMYDYVEKKGLSPST
jgi:hypothetical protein